MRSDFSLEVLNELHNGRHSRRYLHSRSPYGSRHQKRNETQCRSKLKNSTQYGLSVTKRGCMPGKKDFLLRKCCSKKNIGCELNMLSTNPYVQENVLLDSFGCAPYERLYNFDTYSNVTDRVTDDSNSNKKNNHSNKRQKNDKNGTQIPELDVPWHLREVFSSPVSNSFEFLGTKHFWFLVQFSLRVTLLGILIPASIIALKLPYTDYFSSMYTLPAVVIGSSTTVGGSARFLAQFLKAGFIWLPLATACAALNLHRSLVLWLVVYVLLLFLIACFANNVTRRVSLMLLNISMVGQLKGFTSLTFPSTLLLNWFIGLLFALAATLLPYPLLATRSARSTTCRLFSNTATAFCGLLTCFWAVSNTERSMGMVRIRQVTSSLDMLLDKLDSVEKLTFYEFLFFDSFERRKVRLEKAKLLDKLRLNLRSMTRVIDIVHDNPCVIDDSDRCIHFVTSLSRPMESISRAVEELIDGLSHAQLRKDLLQLGSLFEACGCTIKRLQEEFNNASYRYFYEDENLEIMEDFVPLLTFFVFSVVNFWYALDEFHKQMRTEASNTNSISLNPIWIKIKQLFIEKIEFLWNVFIKRHENELRIVLEACKISLSMLIAVVFFYYVQPQLMLLSGPSVIALVSGVNSVQAVQASIARLTGILFGSVIGFFASSLSHSKLDTVVSLCVITAVLIFFSTGQKYGNICSFANFVAITSLPLDIHPTAQMVISRIQQNTFAIMIYCLFSVLVFPVSPGKILMKKRMEIFRSISHIVGTMMDFYGDPLRKESYKQSDSDRTYQSPWNNLTTRENNFRDNELMNNDANGNVSIRISTFLKMPGPDVRISDIFKEVWHLKQEMKEAALIMPFAADERGITPTVYPQKSCEAVHTVLYRIFALIYTMTCSWKLMRDKDYFTEEVQHIMRYVYPVASDIRLSLQRFVNLLVFYVHHPSSSLASELTKCLMQFRALVSELTARKYCAMLKIISAVRSRKKIGLNVKQNKPTEIYTDPVELNPSQKKSDITSLQQITHSTYVFPLSYRGNSVLNNSVESTNGHSPLKRRQTACVPVRENNEVENSPCTVSDDDNNSNNNKHDNNKHDNDSQMTLPLSGEVNREYREEQYREECKTEDSSLRSSRVSLLSSSLDVNHNVTNASFNSSLHNTVYFTDSFVPPITMHDAEGLHSITLALDMMGKELKNALLALEDMVQMKSY